MKEKGADMIPVQLVDLPNGLLQVHGEDLI
jgi:hypothetical protein